MVDRLLVVAVMDPGVDVTVYDTMGVVLVGAGQSTIAD
jgi:hypothetical protein